MILHFTDGWIRVEPSEEELGRKKKELFNVIVEVLRRDPQLCYFQGYHDIVQVIMLVLGPEQAISAVTHLSLLRIRDFMLPTLSAAVIHLRLIPAIIQRADSALYKHLKNTLNQPYFALTSTLTLYAHDIQGYGQIARLFDFLLAREPVISLYLFVAVSEIQHHSLLDSNTTLLDYTFPEGQALRYRTRRV
jgi:TBC1 domain family member 20